MVRSFLGKEIRKSLRYYREERIDSHVEVEPSSEVTPDLIERVSPDTSIVGIGASSILAEIPGVFANNAIPAVEALRNKDEVEGENVIVIGGGTVGCKAGL